MPWQLPERNRLKVYRKVKLGFSQFCQEEHANSHCLGDFEKSSHLAKNEDVLSNLSTLIHLSTPPPCKEYFSLSWGKCHYDFGHDLLILDNLIFIEC